MASDDGGDAKVAAAVAVTAAIFSPRVRELLRRGAVQGLAGALKAGDALASFARGVSHGIQESTEPPRPAVNSSAATGEGVPVGVPIARAPTPPVGATATGAGDNSAPGVPMRPPIKVRRRGAKTAKSAAKSRAAPTDQGNPRSGG
ncbi:MAG: hypothetical protein WKF55_03910 [Gemmatimonadaceae bacterium]